MSENRKINPVMVVMLLGAIILVACVFLSWCDYNASAFGFKESGTIATGWEILTEDDMGDLFEHQYIPAISIALGVIMMIVSLVSLASSNVSPRMVGIFALIFSIVSIVFCGIFINDVTDGIDEFLVSVTTSPGIGLWLCLAGSIVIMITGILSLIMKPAVATADAAPVTETYSTENETITVESTPVESEKDEDKD